MKRRVAAALGVLTDILLGLAFIGLVLYLVYCHRVPVPGSHPP